LDRLAIANKFIHDLIRKLCISHDKKTIEYSFVDNSRLIEEAALNTNPNEGISV